MSEKKRGAPTVGDAYKSKQQIRGGRINGVVSGDTIAAKRVMLRQTPKGTMFAPAPPLSPDLDKKIRESVKRAAAVGIGRRLDRAVKNGRKAKAAARRLP